MGSNPVGGFFFVVFPSKIPHEYNSYLLHSQQWVLSSVAEQWIADPRVTGSNPVVPFLVGVVGNISACHADARGSIPRLGVSFWSRKLKLKLILKLTTTNNSAFVAQLAARRSHNPKVAGSIPVESIYTSPLV